MAKLLRYSCAGKCPAYPSYLLNASLHGTIRERIFLIIAHDGKYHDSIICLVYQCKLVITFEQKLGYALIPFANGGVSKKEQCRQENERFVDSNRLMNI
jgi:hypothetical protein